MNRSRALPWLVLAALWAAFAFYVWSSSGQLPERVATHFGAAGQPNGWMTRSGHIQFTIAAGLVVPGFILGIFALMRYMKAGLNVPNKEYWLSPERQAETFAFITRQGIWFAGLFILFLAGIHYTVLTSNSRSPIYLPPSDVAWVAGSFLAATGVWIAVFFLRFSRKPA